MILVIGLVAAIAACGGDTVDTKEDTSADDTTTTVEATTTTAPSGGEAAGMYFEALATPTPTDDQSAIDASKDGSVARDYATMQNAMARARSGQNLGYEQVVEVEGDEIRLCSAVGEAEDCSVFTDIEVAGNMVTDFVVNGEDPRTRLSIGGNPVAVAGITYTPIGAYLGSSSNQLYIAYEVANGAAAPLQLETYGESYVDGSGQQFSVTESYGPTSPIQPGATATALAIFDGPAPGGQLGVNGFIDDANFTEAPATLEIPAPAS